MNLRRTHALYVCVAKLGRMGVRGDGDGSTNFSYKKFNTIEIGKKSQRSTLRRPDQYWPKSPRKIRSQVCLTKGARYDMVWYGMSVCVCDDGIGFTRPRTRFQDGRCEMRCEMRMQDAERSQKGKGKRTEETRMETDALWSTHMHEVVWYVCNGEGKRGEARRTGEPRAAKA